MSRFERQVKRQKEVFKVEEKPVVEEKVNFSENFNLDWMSRVKRMRIYTILIFIVIGLLVVPVLTNYLGYRLAFILGFSVLSSILVVGIGSLLSTEKVKPIAWLIRFSFVLLVSGAAAVIGSLFMNN